MAGKSIKTEQELKAALFEKQITLTFERIKKSVAVVNEKCPMLELFTLEYLPLCNTKAKVSKILSCWIYDDVNKDKNHERTKHWINNHKWQNCLQWMFMYILDNICKLVLDLKLMNQDQLPSLLRQVVLLFDKRYPIAHQAGPVPLFPIQRIFQYSPSKGVPSQSPAGTLLGNPSPNQKWKDLRHLFNFLINDISIDTKKSLLNRFRNGIDHQTKNYGKLKTLKTAYEFDYKYPKWMVTTIVDGKNTSGADSDDTDEFDNDDRHNENNSKTKPVLYGTQIMGVNDSANNGNFNGDSGDHKYSSHWQEYNIDDQSLFLGFGNELPCGIMGDDLPPSIGYEDNNQFLPSALNMNEFEMYDAGNDLFDFDDKFDFGFGFGNDFGEFGNIVNNNFNNGIGDFNNGSNNGSNNGNNNGNNNNNMMNHMTDMTDMNDMTDMKRMDDMMYDELNSSQVSQSQSQSQSQSRSHDESQSQPKYEPEAKAPLKLESLGERLDLVSEHTRSLSITEMAPSQMVASAMVPSAMVPPAMAPFGTTHVAYNVGPVNYGPVRGCSQYPPPLSQTFFSPIGNYNSLNDEFNNNYGNININSNINGMSDNSGIVGMSNINCNSNSLITSNLYYNDVVKSSNNLIDQTISNANANANASRLNSFNIGGAFNLDYRNNNNMIKDCYYANNNNNNNNNNNIGNNNYNCNNFICGCGNNYNPLRINSQKPMAMQQAPIPMAMPVTMPVTMPMARMQVTMAAPITSSQQYGQSIGANWVDINDISVQSSC